MKIEDLELLRELERLRSIRALARAKKLEPSQVSRKIERIEKVLRVKVFERLPHGVTPSAAGKDFLAQMTLVLGQLEEVTHSLGRRRQEKEAPAIGFAGTAVLASQLVVPVLAEVFRFTPGFRGYVISVSPADLLGAGLRGAFHMAFHFGELDWPKSWKSLPIGRLRWGLFARSRNPLVKRMKSAEDLSELPFVYPLYWDGKEIQPSRDLCPIPQTDRQNPLGTETAQQALELMRQSNLVAFLPLNLVAQGLEEGEIVEIPLERWSRVEQTVFLSVKADVVSQSLYNLVATRAAEFLSRE